MKSLFVLIFILMYSVSLNAETLLKINFKNSDRNPDIYILEKLPKITFDNVGNVLFTLNGNVTSYLHSDLQNYVIENFQFSTIEDIIPDLSDESHDFLIEKGYITICKSSVNVNVLIYDLMGQIIFRDTVCKGSSLSIPCSSFNRGIYILSLNHKSYKFVI